MSEKVHPVLEYAKTHLVMNHPFIATIMLSTDILETDKVPTACTDGEIILINMAFIESLAPGDISKQRGYCKTLIAHEIDHIALLHPFRKGNRDAMLVDQSGQVVSAWNIACDAPVNEMLAADGFDIIPNSVRWPGAVDMSAEEVYEQLIKKTKNNPKVPWISVGDVTDKPSKGDKEGEGNSESPSSREMKTKIKVQKALDVAKVCGKLPASLQRLVEANMEGKVPWRDLLREAFTTITKKDDYTWARFNRRYIHNRLYLPAMEGTQCGPVAIEFDTSGSVGGKELEAFLSEMNSLFEEVNPEKIYAGFCDCKFYGKHTELEEDDLPMTPANFSKITKGGGGTAFSPAFEAIKKEGIQPEVLVYFTDLCGSDFGPEPPYPVIWVTTDSTNAPWGKVIKIEL